MIAAVSCILGLTIARTKLPVFSIDWLLNARQTRSLEPEVILIHDMRGYHHQLTVKRGGTIKCLGVIFYPALTGKQQQLAALMEFKQIMAAVATRRASSELIKAVLESSLLNKVAHRGVLSGWSLDQSIQFDVVLAREYRKRTKNIATSQEANLFLPAALGGLGFRRLSDIIQKRKRAIIDTLHESSMELRVAVTAMINRASRHA